MQSTVARYRYASRALRRRPSCQHIKALARHCHRSATPHVRAAAPPNAAYKYSPAAASAPSWTRCPPRHASIVLRIHALFSFWRTATEEGIAQKFCGERRPSIALHPVAARPRYSSLRSKRSDDSEGLSPRSPTSAISATQKFRRRKLLAPFARATGSESALLPATPDPPHSTKRTLLAYWTIARMQELARRHQATIESFQITFCSAAASRQSRATSLARSTSPG